MERAAVGQSRLYLCLGQDFLNRYAFSTPTFAFFGGFHERVEFQRFFRVDGRFSTSKKIHDFDIERALAFVSAKRLNGFAAVSDPAVTGFPGTETTKRPDPIAGPRSNHMVHPIVVLPCDALASRAHRRKE